LILFDNFIFGSSGICVLLSVRISLKRGFRFSFYRLPFFLLFVIHPGQKAIIASGFSETDRAKELQNLGAGAYIRKPFLLEKIGLAVKEELKK